MSERISGEQALEKIRAALYLLDTIARFAREDVRLGEIVIPFLDFTVTIQVEVMKVEETSQGERAARVEH